MLPPSKIVQATHLVIILVPPLVLLLPKQSMRVLLGLSLTHIWFGLLLSIFFFPRLGHYPRCPHLSHLIASWSLFFPFASLTNHALQRIVRLSKAQIKVWCWLLPTSLQWLPIILRIKAKFCPWGPTFPKPSLLHPHSCSSDTSMLLCLRAFAEMSHLLKHSCLGVLQHWLLHVTHVSAQMPSHGGFPGIHLLLLLVFYFPRSLSLSFSFIYYFLLFVFAYFLYPTINTWASWEHKCFHLVYHWALCSACWWRCRLWDQIHQAWLLPVITALWFHTSCFFLCGSVFPCENGDCVSVCSDCLGGE